MQNVLLLALEGGEPLDRAARWPWHWVRLALYMRMIKNVRTRVEVLVPSQDSGVVERAMPLRWVYFDREALEKHLDKLRGVDG